MSIPEKYRTRWDALAETHPWMRELEAELTDALNGTANGTSNGTCPDESGQDEGFSFLDSREALESEVRSFAEEAGWRGLPGWRVLDAALGWLDRLEAITERNCAQEYEDMREYLNEKIDALEKKLSDKGE